MCIMCSREIFTIKCRQQQNFDSDLKEAWHYNQVTFTPIAKNLMLYCRLIYMLSMLYVRLAIKVKVGVPESFKVGWYPHKITGSRHFNTTILLASKLNLVIISAYTEFQLIKSYCFCRIDWTVIKMQSVTPHNTLKSTEGHDQTLFISTYVTVV